MHCFCRERSAYYTFKIKKTSVRGEAMNNSYFTDKKYHLKQMFLLVLLRGLIVGFFTKIIGVFFAVLAKCFYFFILNFIGAMFAYNFRKEQIISFAIFY